MSFWESIEEGFQNNKPMKKEWDDLNIKIVGVYDLIFRSRKIRECVQSCYTMLRDVALLETFTGETDAVEAKADLSSIDTTLEKVLEVCGQSGCKSKELHLLNNKLSNAYSSLKQVHSKLESSLNNQKKSLQKMGATNELLIKNLDLLGKLLSSPSKACELNDKFILFWNSIHEIMDHELETYPHEIAASMKLQAARSLLDEILWFPKFANKTTVGLGGSFSSGKSSFINSMIDEDVLPVDIRASTAYPTYVCQASEETVAALNCFGQTIYLDRDALQTLNHQHLENISIELRHIVKSLWFCNRCLPFEYIRFLDTPGYSKGEHGNEDRIAALSALQECEALIWLVDCERGGILESDKRFLEDVGADSLPLLVIINKAESKLRSDIDKIVAKSEETLRDAGFSYVNVVPFSCHAKEEFSKELSHITEFLTQFNKPANLARQVFKIVTGVLSQYEEFHTQLMNQSKRLYDTMGLIFAEVEFDENKSSLVDPEMLSLLKEQAKRQFKFSQGFIKQIKIKVKEISDLTKELDSYLKLNLKRNAKKLRVCYARE